MSKSDTIINKVLADSKFCSDLVARPAETLSGLGVDATPDMIAALKGLDPQGLQRLATAFGKQQAAF